MYSKYELIISDFFYNKELNRHIESGKKIYNRHEKMARKALKEFIYDNGHIDGTSMKNNWFQMEEVDVFISHSHRDVNKVQAFAGWLYDEFGLTAFIDSCVWGYCDELLKQIDDMYCKKKEDKTYNYNLRNYTTSHVHIMLSTALTEMIDKTECIMFYNTPNSISLGDDISVLQKEKKKVTLSPWIYHELAMTSFIRKSKPNRENNLIKSRIIHNAYSENNTINIEHGVDEYLDKMITISNKELKMWENYYSILSNKLVGDDISWLQEHEDIYPLDVLYQLPLLSKG